MRWRAEGGNHAGSYRYAWDKGHNKVNSRQRNARWIEPPCPFAAGPAGPEEE